MLKLYNLRYLVRPSIQSLRLFSTTTGGEIAGGKPESDSSSQSDRKQWEPKTESELKNALIKSAFIHAKEVGFNDQAIVEACRDYGYPSTSSAIVKRGPIEIVDYAMAFWLQ